ncbi:39S ribosomal protein L16, mitochondrial [Rhizina undulata]
MRSLFPSIASLTRATFSAVLPEARAGLLGAPAFRSTPGSTGTSSWILNQARAFSASTISQSWLLPKSGESGKYKKGRPRVPTGGSTRGTTVVWGDYGMRLVDHHRRISALQLRNGEETIKRKLRGMKFRLYMRIAANIPVFTKGNETRMGTGKGSMDYWASRVPVSRIIFELKGEIHEKVAREAFRLAADKMPGKYEFVKKGDYPMTGTTKLTPEAVEKLLAKKTPYPLNRKALQALVPKPAEPVATPEAAPAS